MICSEEDEGKAECEERERGQREDDEGVIWCERRREADGVMQMLFINHSRPNSRESLHLHRKGWFLQ